MRVAIAGASGFVGRALIEAVASDHDVVALTRSAEGRPGAGSVAWRGCDLFNLREAEEAVRGCDAAFYLVHSMMPSTRLAQGAFEDMDLLCADNLARAARTAKLRHIIYLGGLVPARSQEPLSRHLESRLEVEQTLAAHGVPVTTLRAGMVVGAGGSSFQMMTRLVRRLPLMLGPRWTRSRSQSIALTDIIALLRYALDHPELSGHAYDVGCPDVVSYAEMLVLTGAALGKRTRVVTLPITTPRLSLLWISLVAGAPSELVRPLIESLRHDMVASDGLVLQARAGREGMSLRAAIDEAVKGQAAQDRSGRPAAPTRSAPPRGHAQSLARSVQRLPCPPGRDAAWVAAEYVRWLPRFMRPFLRVDVDAAGTCRFFAWPVRRPLLVLAFAAERSAPDRQLFYVTGGLLVRGVAEAAVPARARARLEFRSVLGDACVLAAVHDFAPRLPWRVYAVTQALVHLLVMKRFGGHLGKLSRRPAAAPT